MVREDRRPVDEGAEKPWKWQRMATISLVFMLNYITFCVKQSRAFCCYLLLKINIFDFLSKNGHFQRILKLLKIMIILVVVNFI